MNRSDSKTQALPSDINQSCARESGSQFPFGRKLSH